MYKLAQLKEAEVRGVVAALVDNGVLAIDSAEQFEKTASDASALLEGYDYDINDVANAAAYSLQKQAEEVESDDLNDQVTSTLGELTLSKMAGEIDENTFNYYADAIVKQAAEVNDDQKKDSKKIPMSHRLGLAGTGAVAGLAAGMGPEMRKEMKGIQYALDKQRLGTKAALKNAFVRGSAKANPLKTLGRAVGAGLAVNLAYQGGRKALQAYKNRKNKQD